MHVKFIHRREGASAATGTDAVPLQKSSPSDAASQESDRKGDLKVVEDTKPAVDEATNDPPMITVVQPLKDTDEREKQGIVLADSESTLADRRHSGELSSGSHSPSRHSPRRATIQVSPGQTPSPPPKSFRNSLINFLMKRN